METQIVAPFSGRVRQIIAIPNIQVSSGDPLLQLEPVVRGSENRKAISERVSFAHQPVAGSGEPAWRQNLAELRELMLGFDSPPQRVTRLVNELKQMAVPEAYAEELTRREDEILNIFVDLCLLFRTRPRADHQVGAESPSTEAYLFQYLRVLDIGGADLPEDFIQTLQQAVAHYGITSLERSCNLEQTLLWIYKAHQKSEQQIGPILGVLQRRLAQAGQNPDWASEDFRTLLDRMTAMSRELFPTINDLARELRYRCYEQPFFELARRQVYATMEEHLDYLAEHPDASDTQQRLRALVECPQPLASLFAGRFPSCSMALRQFMMQAITSRYYSRRLTNFRTLAIDGHCFTRAEYEEEGNRRHVFMAYGEYRRLVENLRDLFPFFADVPDDEPIKLDLFTWENESVPDADRTQAEIHEVLNSVEFPRAIHRIVVAVSGAHSQPGTGRMLHFTYELSENGYEEVQLFRGVHPMIGERLHLWRLKNFNLERLPSAEDVYLLRAVGKDNPKDERLFAVAEVRDLTPVRDERARIVQLPHLERMFAETVAAIRQYQMQRSLRERLYWNRIFLYVWPTLALRPDEVDGIVHRLAPMADGLGLEQVVVRLRIPESRAPANYAIA